MVKEEREQHIQRYMFRAIASLSAANLGVCYAARVGKLTAIIFGELGA